MGEQPNEHHRDARFALDEPSRFLADELDGLERGARVLDLACGRGRNAVWLAEQGFRVTAIDLSGRAIRSALELASEREVDLEWICGNVTRFVPPSETFRLALMLYLHIPAAERRVVLGLTAQALAPGGELLMVGHERRSFAGTAREPQGPEMLFDRAEIAEELAGAGLEVECSGYLPRPLSGRGEGCDVFLRARRKPS